MSTYTVKRILSHKVVDGQFLYYEAAWKHGGEHTWHSFERFNYTVLSRYWKTAYPAAAHLAAIKANAQEKVAADADAAAARLAALKAEKEATKAAKAQEKTALKAEKEATKTAPKAEKEATKTALKAEKEATKAALKAEKEATKAAIKAEKEATKAALKAEKEAHIGAIRLAKAQEAAAAATELAARRAAVAAMNDHQLIAEFIRLFGKMALPCTHCNGETHVINWVHSIRKRAMRNGLTTDMKLPKTCDDQQARNMISNPVNNPAYYRLRDTARLCPQDNAFALLVQQRKDGLAAVGIAAKPYKYIPSLSSP
jgi:hypothetical protein